VISAQEWYRVLLLSQSLDDSETTLGEYLGRTQWSSLLDSTTYLYYFTSGCTPISTRSHVLSEHSMITWPGHVIWLSNLPCYLYLDPVIRLDVRDQMCECMGDSFLPGALITLSWFHPIMDLERSPSMTFFLDRIPAYPVCFPRYQHEFWVGSPLLNVFIIW